MRLSIVNSIICDMVHLLYNTHPYMSANSFDDKFPYSGLEGSLTYGHLSNIEINIK